MELNGQPLVKTGTAEVGTFLQIKAAFKAGDVITASFGMAAHFEKINDNRTAYDNVGSVHYGPYALVALSDGDYALKADLKDIGTWLKLSPAGTAAGKKTMLFTATGTDGKTLTLLPLNRVVDQNYSAHLNISTDATQCICGGCSEGTAVGTEMLTWNSKTLVPVGDGAAVNALIRSGNPGEVSAVMMQGAFIGKGTITGVELSLKYTVGYSSAPGKKGSTIGLAFYPSTGVCPQEEPASTKLWTSPEYLTPDYDKTHAYAPVNISLCGLNIDVSQPGARLGLHFEDNDHNLQVLLPIQVKLTWAVDEHGHRH